VDHDAIIARLRSAHADIGTVLDAMLDGEQVRASWTRLLAHNVNNHLTSIFYIIERFAHANPDSTEEQAIYANGLKDVAGRIQETISRLMHLSRSDSLVQRAPFTVADAIEEVVKRHAGYASLKSIRLDSRVEIDDALRARGDRLGFVESLLNLVGNAIKYSPRNTTVAVAARRVGSTVDVSIRDEGPGITADDQTKLFRVGGIAASKPTAGEPQTGIGLAMSAALVRAMGGEIAVSSEPGKGSTFSIRLPIAESD
jgi:two-component system sensor histidine kinase SenX3